MYTSWREDQMLDRNVWLKRKGGRRKEEGGTKRERGREGGEEKKRTSFCKVNLFHPFVFWVTLTYCSPGWHCRVWVWRLYPEEPYLSIILLLLEFTQFLSQVLPTDSFVRRPVKTEVSHPSSFTSSPNPTIVKSPPASTPPTKREKKSDRELTPWRNEGTVWQSE